MNQIDIHFNNEPSEIENEVMETIQSALDIFGINNAFLEITFVSPKEIQILNQKYRKIDKPTDVLSFPQALIPEAKVRMLGSIAISKQVAEEKEEHITDVVKHGLLHLLGYDHEINEKSWQEAANKINCKL